MAVRSMIVIEANEVPFRIFDAYCANHPESALSRVLGRSSQYQTHTEDKARFIMPWTTWPSMHRGVNDEAHQIFKFGQWEIPTDVQYPPIWRLLAEGGIRTGVFSSMQSAPLPSDGSKYSFYFPDMFANDAKAHPVNLEVLQEFNLAMTRENARNVSRRVNVGGALPFLAKSLSLGVKPGTFLAVARQLASEIGSPWRKTRRRALQPLIMLDVFEKLLRERRPQYSTFFTNHVAAAMHRYWAAAFPGDYANFSLDKSWVEKYRGEIEFAMSRLDMIVARLARFVDQNSDYMLVIATSMGQAAIPASHVREFMTITDMRSFLSALNVPWQAVEERPAMVPDFGLRVVGEAADELERALGVVSIGGVPIKFHRQGEFFYFSIYDERSGLDVIRVGERDVAAGAMGLGYLVHEDEVACTAQHVPQGSLITYSPHDHSSVDSARKDVSALEFAPAVLRHFGIDPPEYMRAPSFSL
jgi:hypothetical protein